MLLVLPRTAQAADPLTVAQARVTDAIKAADKAVGDLKAAEVEYFHLEQQVATTGHAIDRLRVDQQRLAKLARLRAVAAYRGGTVLIDDLIGSDGNVMDAARRATMLDRVNARGNEAIDQLGGITSELHRREKSLRNDIKRQEKAVRDMKEREARTRRAVEEAQRAEQALRARLVAEKRAAEFAARVVRRAPPLVHSPPTPVAVEAWARSSCAARGSVPCRARCRSKTTSVTREAEGARTRAPTCSPPQARRSLR